MRGISKAERPVGYNCGIHLANGMLNALRQINKIKKYAFLIANGQQAAE